MGDDNKDTHKIGIIISETDLLVNALHADLVVAWYRCSLKAGLDAAKR